MRMSLVMSCGEDKEEDSDKETMYQEDDVMNLSKHIDKFQTCCDDLRDSTQSSFASASGCEADSMVSGDEICSEDVETKHKDCALGNGISIALPPHQKLILEEPILSESPKIRSCSKRSVATKFQASYMCNKKPLSPIDSLAASLQRGLHIIESHQQRSSSLSNTSSVSFSFSTSL